MSTTKIFFILLSISLLKFTHITAFEAPSLVRLSKSKAAAISEIQKVVGSGNYAKLQRLITKYIGKTISLTTLNRIAIAESNLIVQKAIRATQMINNIPNFRSISKANLLAISLFIEAELPSYISRGKFYVLGKHVGLSHDIEYITENDLVFIHLQKEIIGTGYKKLVSKSILYSQETPEIVAHLQQDGVMDREAKITLQLNGHEGILEVIACSQKRINGQLKTALFTKLYSPGSLDKVFNLDVQFSFKEKVSMALNVAKGLEYMHLQGIAHNDLGPKNHLVNIIRNSPSASADITHVLADFGRSRPCANLNGYKPQGNTLYKSPEGFLKSNLSGNDYKRCDIFALGCVFFRLFYQKFTAWQELKPIWGKMENMSRVKSYLYKVVKNQTDPRRNHLNTKKKIKELSKKEKIEFLILEMLHYRKDRRPSATAIRVTLENVYSSL